VRALRLESYRPPKKKRALSLDSVLPNEKGSTPSSLTDGAAAANNSNANSHNSNSSNYDNTIRRRGKSQERADRLSDDADAAGDVASREGSRRSGDGGSNNSGSGGAYSDNSNATTARGSREPRESLELPCGPFDEEGDPRGAAWVEGWGKEGAKVLGAAFAKADLENDK